MAKRLLILGASSYQVPQIAQARECGCEVVVVDRNPSAPAFAYADAASVVDISDQDGVLMVARREAVDGILPINDVGVETAAVVASELGLVGIPPEVARIATSKVLMREVWAESAVPSARFRLVESADEAAVAVPALGGWPVIVKPSNSRGGGSRGVSRVEGEAELDRAVAFAKEFWPDEPVLVEEYIHGLEHSVEVLVHGGEVHILAVSDKVKTPPPYRVDKQVIYPSVLRGEDLDAIHETVRAAVRAVGIDVGAGHVELCSTANGPRLFEIGARCGGGATPHQIVPFVTGVELFKEVVRVLIGETPQNLRPSKARGAVYHFFTPEPGLVRSISGAGEVASWEGVLDCCILAHAGSEIPPVRTGHDRSGHVVTAASDRAGALAMAAAAEDAIRFEYAGEAPNLSHPVPSDRASDYRLVTHSKPELSSDDSAAVEGALRRGFLAQGEEVRLFEREMTEYLSVADAVATSTGTDALVLLLRALDVGAGDEVILPTYVCRSVWDAVRAVGAVPVLCDIGDDWCASVEQVTQRVTRRTRAIVVVHSFGIVADVQPLVALGVPIIEDCCQALGASREGVPAGSWGVASILSFHATKLLTTGEGGMVVTRSPELGERLRSLRDGTFGLNRRVHSPLSDLQAALGRSQLARFDTFLERRQALAARYLEELRTLPVRLPEQLRGRSNFFRFPLHVDGDFDMLRQRFAASGVQVRRGVDKLLHREAGMHPRGFPRAEHAFAHTLSIPLYPALTEAELDHVIRVCRRVLHR